MDRLAHQWVKWVDRASCFLRICVYFTATKCLTVDCSPIPPPGLFHHSPHSTENSLRFKGHGRKVSLVWQLVNEEFFWLTSAYIHDLATIACSAWLVNFPFDFGQRVCHKIYGDILVVCNTALLTLDMYVYPMYGVCVVIFTCAELNPSLINKEKKKWMCAVYSLLQVYRADSGVTEGTQYEG